jgi:prepilin-type N-terminal cleavage/methylation domain-containing protein
MMIVRRWAGDKSDGFTLVEMLAALAIASVIIIASAALIRNIALYFDRGTRNATESERLMLAVARLASDFGSARYIARQNANGATIAFTAEQKSVTFVGAGGVATQSADDEVVNLAIEQDGDVRRLVRRRATWPGQGARFEEITVRDPVTLIEGRLDMSFVFGRISPDGKLVWYSSWTGETSLPSYVRLNLRDRDSGRDLLGEASFLVHADAPPACGKLDPVLTCLAAAPMLPTNTSERSAQ